MFPHALRGAVGAAALLLGLGMAAHPAAAQVAAEPSISEQLVNGLEGVFGQHAGRRRSGARGFCATGEWMATGAAAPITTASTLQPGARATVVARFSLGGGNPNAPENAPGVRGLSFAAELPGGDTQEFVLINTPVFTARTPESFVNFLRVRAPDPQTRQMNSAAVAAANAANPDWTPQMAYVRENAPPRSYATSAYFGINSFVLVNRAGQRQHVRWTFEPVAGRHGLSPEERQARGPAFLEAELRERLAAGPAEWRVLLQFPEAGDPLDDAVTAWPASRRTLEVARLRITALAGPEACDARLFNPVLLPDGIEPSADPILNARAEAYAVSLSRRLQ